MTEVEKSLRNDLIKLLAQRSEVDEKITQTKAAIAGVIAAGKEFGETYELLDENE